MDDCSLEAITDIDTLRRMVREQHVRIAQYEAMLAERDTSLVERDATIAAHTRTLRERDALIGKLTFELARLRRLQFAARSERMDAVQRGLFDEAMAEDIAALEAQLEAAQGKNCAPAPKAPRTKPQRRTLPPELERVTTVHEPDHCDCAACGAALVRIGEHAHSQRHWILARPAIRRLRAARLTGLE